MSGGKYMSQPVVLKSNPHGINLILDDRIPFQELLDEILHKFKDSLKMPELPCLLRAGN